MGVRMTFPQQHLLRYTVKPCIATSCTHDVAIHFYDSIKIDRFTLLALCTGIK